MEAGSIIGGRWILDGVLGVGGTATVYAAHDAAGAQVALKLLRPELAARPDVRERFLRERLVADRIDHPGVVSVLDLDASDPAASYLVLERLEGETLAERAKRVGVPRWEELLGIVDQVLDVLAVAHARGIVHRDLKPGNLFLTRDGRVKLLDFGVARLLDPTARPSASVMLGTAAYMAPEQAQGKSAEIDPRTDLFALGALLFRLLSGRRVHEAQSDADLLTAMATLPAPQLATVAAQVPVGVCSIVDVALSFSKDARYPAANLMQQDVRAVLDGRVPPFATNLLLASERATVYGAPSSGPVSSGRVAAPTAEASLEGQIISERYRVEELLGSGGMGAVYRGTHVAMRKGVAIKVLHREMTAQPEAVARFEREAVAAARIDHPNVVAATDFGRLDDGSFFLVLEFVQGQSLRSLLDAGGPLPSARALGIARQIVSALSAAHAAGIVHRDLKPDNVMLVERGGETDFVKVLDFGIAKVSVEGTAGQPALTQVGTVFGTPEYMSPEQAKGEAVDARADLYTVGVLLYEMLCGKTPFARDDMIAVLMAHMTEPPPPLPAMVDPAISELVMRMLAKEPSERVQTADDSLARIEALLGSAAPSAALAAPARTGVGFGPTVLHLPALSPARLPAVLEPLARHVPQLARQLRLGGLLIPVWVLAVAGLGLAGLAAVLLIGVLVASRPGSSQSETLRPTTSAVPGAPRPVESPWAKRAAAGDREALSRLQAKPEAQRSLEEWRAMGHGYARISDLQTSLAAYAQAVRLDASVAADAEVLRDVRAALEAPASQNDAIALCRTSLGSGGADLLYDLWAANRKSGTRKDLTDRLKQALDSPDSVGRASPALQVAWGLQGARGCATYKDLLARAATQADARSEPFLTRLQATGGCGFLGLADCFSCIRGDRNLSRALDRARSTPAPKFASQP